MPTVHAHVRVVMPDGSAASRAVNVEVSTDPADHAVAESVAASRALQRAASDVIAVLDLPDPSPAPEPVPATREGQGS